MWKYHRCYGYIMNRAFHTKKLLKWNGLVVHWCLYNKKNITWLLGDTKFLFSCWKNISLVRCAHQWNIFQHSKRNFVSPRSHVISSICVMVWLRIIYTWLHGRVDFYLPCLWSLQKTLPHQVSFILKREKKRRKEKHAIFRTASTLCGCKVWSRCRRDVLSHCYRQWIVRVKIVYN